MDSFFTAILRTCARQCTAIQVIVHVTDGWASTVAWGLDQRPRRVNNLLCIYRLPRRMYVFPLLFFHLKLTKFYFDQSMRFFRVRDAERLE